MNDGIPKEICSLRYPTIDLAIGQILQLGGGTQLSKLDIKDAYRIVPEHPQDWKLLGLFWKGSYYIDTRLPFGLGSAPKIFADEAQWLIMQRGGGPLPTLPGRFPLPSTPGGGGNSSRGGFGYPHRVRNPPSPRKTRGPNHQAYIPED